MSFLAIMVTQTELEFRAQGGGRTQNVRLRDYFLARPKEWIPMPELARVITETGIGAAVHSRVADLRKKFGMIILHKGGSKSLYYYDDGTQTQNPNLC